MRLTAHLIVQASATHTLHNYEPFEKCAIWRRKRGAVIWFADTS